MWRITIHEQGASTSGNLEIRTIKRSSQENFQPSRNGFGSPGKNDKRRTAKKLSLKKIRIKSLEGKEIGGQDTPERKVSKKLLGKQHQKKQTMRNKEMNSHQSGWHNMDSSTQRSRGGESMVPRNPKMTL